MENRSNTRNTELNFVYLRVSTDDKGQNPELQLQDCLTLLGDKPYEVFKEEVSAWREKDRPIFDAMVKRALQEKIARIVVWDLDRLYRNRVKMVSFVKEMAKVNCKVVSTRQKWLESLHQIPYPWNEIVFDLVINIIGWMAEEESQKKSERVKMAVTKKYGKTYSRQGKKWGRPTISSEQRRKIRRFREEGLSIRQIASQMRVGKSTVSKVLSEKG
jgi:DNA invertase Pin-like site-specific DNA recombinase